MKPKPYRYVLAAKVYSYLDRHEAAVRVLSEGVADHPSSPDLLRHRGHFHIVLRAFDDAIADLAKASELLADREDEIEFYEAQLMPDVENILLGREPALMATPTPVNDDTLSAWRHVYKGTLKSSTWYHLALAHYFKGEFGTAAGHYREALALSVDNDMRAASLDWLYVSLRRAERQDEARSVLASVDLDMPVVEPSYLHRLRIYAGRLEPDAAPPSTASKRVSETLGYGIGVWHLCNDHGKAAIDAFERVVATGKPSAFGYIAAEADLQRMRTNPTGS